MNIIHNFFLATKALICLIGIIILSSCSIESSITDINPKPPDTEDSSGGLAFVHGESTITSAGTPNYQVNAVFGEISEKTKSINGNGWKLEGVFYE